MLTGILGLLTAIAPLITSAGLYLIQLFVSNAADREAAQKNFLSAIQDHLNDALQSVETRKSAAQQAADLKAELDAADAAPQPPPTQPTPKP